MTKTITRDFLRTLRADMDAALAEVAKKHGVAINAGSASFTPTTATYKLAVAIPSEEAGDSLNATRVQAANAWGQWAGTVYGLKPEWLGQEINVDGKKFTLLGLIPSRRRFPVLAMKQSTGKETLLTIEHVKRYYASQAIPA